MTWWGILENKKRHCHPLVGGKTRPGGPKILVKIINIFIAILEFLTSHTAYFPCPREQCLGPAGQAFFLSTDMSPFGHMSFSWADVVSVFPWMQSLTARSSSVWVGSGCMGSGGRCVVWKALLLCTPSPRCIFIFASIFIPFPLLHRQPVGTAPGNVMINYPRKLG